LKPGVALLPGPLVGVVPYHSQLNSPGLVFGGEVSVVKYNLNGVGLLANNSIDPTAAGFYIDGLWDFGADAARFSIGPELVWLFAGLDIGYMMQIRSGGQVGHGISARVFVSLLVPSLYIRGATIFAGEPDAFIELGILVKIPFLDL
jgi:hypothetical protein